MTNHGDRERSLYRCTDCNATLISRDAPNGLADAGPVCAECGRTLVDSPVEGGDYFDVVMRVSHTPRIRRAS